VAKNRYGWAKRAKEIARKQKYEEKLKRRQGKSRIEPVTQETEAGAGEAGEKEESPPGEALAPLGPTG
jgi:hypothetical protein